MLYNGLIDATLISLLYRRSPRDPAIAEDVLQALPVLASSCGILLKLGTVTPASESLFSGQRHIKRVADQPPKNGSREEVNPGMKGLQSTKVSIALAGRTVRSCGLMRQQQ